MQIENSTPLTFGWVVGKIEPPQWTASFFLKGTFAIDAAGEFAWAEEPRQLSGDVHADDDPSKELVYPSDFAPMKPRADVLIAGSAHAPGGQPAPRFSVGFRVGKLQRTLTVFGERQWKTGLISTTGTTPPAPVSSVSLSYRNAFGGPSFAKNPLGRGRKSDSAPLIEDPSRPVRGPSDDVDPAGFGPLPAAWPQRAGFRGTYDKDWLKNRWPWFPKDFDWSYFNAAPRDQQVDGYLVGDETLEFENLHPEVSSLKSRLPGLRPRCFVADRAAQGESRFREAPLVLDTFWADVGKGVAVLVWRGRLDVRTVKLREVERIVVAIESLSEKPFPAEHYRNVAAPVDEAPPAAPAAAPPAEDAMAGMDAEFAKLDESFAALEKELAEARAAVDADLTKRKAAAIARGVDPTAFAVAAAAEPSAVAEFDRLLKTIEAKNPAMLAQAESHRAWIAKAEADLAALPAEMDAMEKSLAADAAAFAAERPAAWTRERVAAAVAAGTSLEGENLQELDLSGLTLSRAGFRNASLAKANLSGAKLDEADFSGADLTAAAFAKADLRRAKFDGADLTEATFPEAALTGVSLTEATLPGVDLSGADLSECRCDRADFAGANFSKAKLDRASLIQADFTSANLEAASLKGATLRAAQFEGVKAKGVICDEADISGLHGSGASDFTGGSFKSVRGDGAIFSEAILNGADFTSAKLAKAQFGDASLRRANFDRADLRGATFDDADLSHARLTRANLLQAGLDRALLVESDCRGSNFYEAGFWDALTDNAQFKDANLKATLLKGGV